MRTRGRLFCFGALIALAAAGLGEGAGGWAGAIGLASDQSEERAFELRIENGEVALDQRLLRVRQGDRVRLRWTTDAPATLHLHGYDIEKEVAPGQVTEFRFDAHAAGRFAVEVHGKGADQRSHHGAPLVVLEVYPR